MEIQTREREGITIADLDGRLVLGDANGIFRDTMKKLFDSSIRKVILNLGNVAYIDSSGLGSLVVCVTSYRKAGGDIKLLNLTRRHMELLVITKLTTVFEIFLSEQDAVNSFFPDRHIQRFDILSFVQQQEDQEQESQ
jgi:anti-sigma B factor antagonist